MDEAIVEHAGAKDLIAQLEAMEPGDDLYDAKVTVLGEEIDHHVKEEESDMFPKAKKAKVDTAELGEEMAERRVALMAELGISEEDDE
jgi:CO dehydrogenase/acetyl-CoA synthase beta subunit